MGFSVVPLVQAGLGAWMVYQWYRTGKNIVNDRKVQKSWEEGEYINIFKHSVPHLPVFGDAMRGGRALAQGNSKAAYLWPANAIFTLYGGKVIGKGFRSIFNRVIPEINKLRFGRWINKQGGKVVKGAATKISSATVKLPISYTRAQKVFGKNVKKIVTRERNNGKGRAYNIEFEDGTKIDINPDRVKMDVPKPQNPSPGGMGKHDFIKDGGLPESTKVVVKGTKTLPHKRTLTEAEIKLLEDLIE